MSNPQQVLDVLKFNTGSNPPVDTAMLSCPASHPAATLPAQIRIRINARAKARLRPPIPPTFRPPPPATFMCTHKCSWQHHHCRRHHLLPHSRLHMRKSSRAIVGRIDVPDYTLAIGSQQLGYPTKTLAIGSQQLGYPTKTLCDWIAATGIAD
jgi:hypothetical protein